MNSQIFIREIKSTRALNICFKALIGILIFTSQNVMAEWTVDFSRRANQMGSREYVSPNAVENAVEMPTRGPASVVKEESSFVDSIFQQVVPTEEIVVLNTEQGFLPSTIRLKEGMQYRFVVVNINEKAKNVSFIMDAFSEHHATFYGQMKSFYVLPKKEGIFSFVSPETSAQGRVIVQGSGMKLDSQPTVDIRSPAGRGE